MRFYALLMLVLCGPMAASESYLNGLKIGDPESGMHKADKLYEKDNVTYYRAPRNRNKDYKVGDLSAEKVQIAFESGYLTQIELTTPEIRPNKGQYCFEAEQVEKIEKELVDEFGAPVLVARTHSGPESFRMLANEYETCRALRTDVYDCEIAVFEKWPDQGDGREYALEVVLNSIILGNELPEGGDRACLVQIIYRQGKHVDKHPDALWDDLLDE